jgi:hypothetical protein
VTDRIAFDQEELKVKLNTETGRISWQELLPHFARGVVIRVAGELDLVEVASRFAADDKGQVTTWLTSGEVARASDQDAREWNQASPEFWAVVVAPWVLVQVVRMQ